MNRLGKALTGSVLIALVAPAAFAQSSSTVWDLGTFTTDEIATKSLEQITLMINNTCCKADVPTFVLSSPDVPWIRFAPPRTRIISPGDRRTFFGWLEVSQLREPGDYSARVTVVCDRCEPRCESSIEIRIRIEPPPARPEPGPTHMPPDQIDPAAKYCGPEIAPAVQDAIQRLYDRVLDLPRSEKGAWDGAWFLNRNGNTIDLRLTKLLNSAGDNVCPTQSCTVGDAQHRQSTITLCGVCVMEHIGNDILYGAICELLGVPYGVQRAGGYWQEGAYYGGIDPPASQAAYAIGNELVNGLTDGRISIGDLCSIVNSTAHPVAWAPPRERESLSIPERRAIALMIEEQAMLRDCLPCPNRAPARVWRDWSTSTWYLSDGTRQTRDGSRVNSRGEPID